MRDWCLFLFVATNAFKEKQVGKNPTQNSNGPNQHFRACARLTCFTALTEDTWSTCAHHLS